MSESLLRKLSQYNTMFSFRHEKGAGPIVVKTSLAFALSRKCEA